MPKYYRTLQRLVVGVLKWDGSGVVRVVGVGDEWVVAGGLMLDADSRLKTQDSRQKSEDRKEDIRVLEYQEENADR